MSRLSLASDVCVLILLSPLRFDSLLITVVRTASGYCGRDVTSCNNFNPIADRGLDRHKKEPRAVDAAGVSAGCCLSL